MTTVPLWDMLLLFRNCGTVGGRGQAAASWSTVSTLQIEGWTDIQIDRQAGRQAHKQADRQVGKQTDGQASRQADR